MVSFPMSNLATLLDSAAKSQGFEVVMESGQPVVVTTPRGPSPLGDVVPEDHLFSLLTEVLTDDQQAELAVGNVIEFKVDCDAGRWNLLAEPGAEGISVQGRLQAGSPAAAAADSQEGLQLPAMEPFGSADSEEISVTGVDGSPPPRAYPDPPPLPSASDPGLFRADLNLDDPVPSADNLEMDGPPPPPPSAVDPNVTPARSTLQFRFDAEPEGAAEAAESWDGSDAGEDAGAPGPDPVSEETAGAEPSPEGELADAPVELGTPADDDDDESLDLGAPLPSFPDPPDPPNDPAPPPEAPPVATEGGFANSAPFVDPHPPLPPVGDLDPGDSGSGLAGANPDASTQKDLEAVHASGRGNVTVPNPDQLEEIGGSLPPATLCYVLGDGAAEVLAESIGGVAVLVDERMAHGQLARPRDIPPDQLTVIVVLDDPSTHLGWILRRLEEGSRILVETRATSPAGARRILLGIEAHGRAEVWLDSHEQVALVRADDAWALRPM